LGVTVIVGNGSEEKMFGVDARRIVALVTDNETFRDFAVM
jgi:hypothetical protein